MLAGPMPSTRTESLSSDLDRFFRTTSTSPASSFSSTSRDTYNNSGVQNKRAAAQGVKTPDNIFGHNLCW